MIAINLILVGSGGALGSICRYLTFELTNLLANESGSFMGTMLVNIIGSFLAGIIFFVSISKTGLILPQTRLLIMTGFLGGFTTFSAFSLDTLRFVNDDRLSVAVCYVVASVALSLLAIFIGFYLAQYFVGSDIK